MSKQPILDNPWPTQNEVQLGGLRLPGWAHQQGCETEEELPVKLGKNWATCSTSMSTFLRFLDHLNKDSRLANGLAEGCASSCTAGLQETAQAVGWTPKRIGRPDPGRQPRGSGGETTGPNMRPPRGSTAIRHYHQSSSLIPIV